MHIFNAFGLAVQSYRPPSFGEISFQKYVSARIAHPFFYGDLVYKLMRVKGAENFVSSGSKTVKRLRHRKYDPVIIKMTIGLVRDPSVYSLLQIFPKALHSNKTVETIWRDLSKPPLADKVQILLPSDCYAGLLQSLNLSSLPDGRSTAYSGGCLYILLIYCFYHLRCLCNDFYGLSA